MRVILIHQHDPTLHYPAGIGTFIRTFVKYAPVDLDIDLIGVTADCATHPVGRWQHLSVEGRTCRFLPVLAAHPNQRGRIPLSVRLMEALARHRRQIEFEGALLEFHRIEPSLILRDLPNPKVLFLHAHMRDLYNPKTDVRWGKCPWLYFQLERRLIHAMERIYIVREDAVPFYRARYPRLADRIAFLPTWVDEEVFLSLPESQRIEQKQALGERYGFDPSHRVLLFVGRFDSQKDPQLLLESFRHLNGLMSQTRLIMIGEGALEPAIHAFLVTHGLGRLVRLIGSQSPSEVARWMNIADCLVLSSAYEGMPRVVVEALRCGLPVVSTDVGEARRLIRDASVGRLVRERDPRALGSAIAEILKQPADRLACQRQAEPYAAPKVLEPVYQTYRDLTNGVSGA